MSFRLHTWELWHSTSLVLSFFIQLTDFIYFVNNDHSANQENTSRDFLFLFFYISLKHNIQLSNPYVYSIPLSIWHTRHLPTGSSIFCIRNSHIHIFLPWDGIKQIYPSKLAKLSCAIEIYKTCIFVHCQSFVPRYVMDSQSGIFSLSTVYVT